MMVSGVVQAQEERAVIYAETIEEPVVADVQADVQDGDTWYGKTWDVTKRGTVATGKGIWAGCRWTGRGIKNGSVWTAIKCGWIVDEEEFAYNYALIDEAKGTLQKSQSGRMARAHGIGVVETV